MNEKSIKIKHPHLVKYFKNEMDSELYTINSNKYVELVCPNCGYEKTMQIKNFTRAGFACHRCSSGVSIPEKFFMEILLQTNLKFEKEFMFRNSDIVRYDYYINDFNIIVELHGGQHYTNSFETVSNTSLEEQINKDMMKKKYAQIFDINDYIEIDCRKSDFSWISNNIKESNLNLYLKDFDIDYELAWKNTLYRNDIKAIVDLYNECKDLKIIKDRLKLSINFIKKSLKIGSSLGLCCIENLNPSPTIVYKYDFNFNKIGEYKSKKEFNRLTGCSIDKNKGFVNSIKHGCYFSYLDNLNNEYIKLNTKKPNIVNKRRVNKYDLNGKYICTYESISSAGVGLCKNTTSSAIYDVLSGRKKAAYGFIWKYAE